MEKRGSFTGSIGFVLAAAGSAVGLGNLWRFPYLVAKYGGGMFILIYIIIVLTLGYTLMTAEIAMGRKTGQSSLSAYGTINKKCGFFGVVNALVPIIITPYYCVIGGWVLKFLWTYITTPAQTVAESDVFANFVFNPSAPIPPIFWFLLFLAITVIIVCMGVDKGIENVSKIMMPILIVLVIFVAIYCCLLPGANIGIKHYLLPNFDDLKPLTVLAAMTQSFFSLSVAMGIMITYGSYMKKESSIEKSVWQICAFDTIIALLAGLAIIPAVFALTPTSDLENTLKAGPSLMFIILPKVFAEMAMGRFVATIFFVLVFFAAITSAISLFEAIVAIFVDQYKIKRSNSILVSIVICLIIGLLSSLGYGPLENVTIMGLQFLDFFDTISNNIIMPIVGLFICIIIGWVAKVEYVKKEIEVNGDKFKLEGLFTAVIKYIGPILIIVILIGSLLQIAGVFSI